MNSFKGGDALKHPLFWTILASLLSCSLLCIGELGDDLIPFGDGVGFALRAIELHGLLHSGQFAKFVDVLLLPSTFTYVPTYLLFLLLPSSLATGAAYGLITCLCWNLLLAFGLYGLLKTLGKPELSPWLFLLCAANNYALDPAYFFYMDLIFMGSVAVVVWLQVSAWQKKTARSSFTAGLAAGGLLLVKPANAFLLILLFIVAVVAHGITTVFVPRYMGHDSLRKKLIHGLWLLGGAMIPIGIVLVLGALQLVLARLTEQSSYYTKTWLHCEGLLRLFYFPLCLGYFYSFVLVIALGLVVLALVMILRAKGRGQPSSSATNAFTRDAVISIAVAYVVTWGLAFSFVMPAKTIRSLPAMLPMVWVCLAHAPGLRRVPIWGAGLFCGAYFLLAHIQAFTGVSGKANLGAEHFDLADDWYNRLPQRKDMNNLGANITHDIRDSLEILGVSEGRIANGTEMMFWTATSLNWLTQVPYLRKGDRPPCTYVTACDYYGYPIQCALEDCNAMILIVKRELHYSEGVYEFNFRTANHAIRNWRGKEASDIRSYNGPDGKPYMVIVVMREPLSAKSVEALMASEFPQGFSGFAALDETIYKRRSIKECLRLLFEHGKAKSLQRTTTSTPE